MSARQFVACKVRVANRGVAPDAFLNTLLDVGTGLPAEVFAQNSQFDIYSSTFDDLGPWRGALHRRAVMLECLRVLAGFESSWNWSEGVDTTNRTSMENLAGQESGIFQVSANSMNFDPSLKALVHDRVGSADYPSFIAAMKSDHALAIEYAARLLRFTVRHNGPVLRKEINPWLSRSSVVELEGFLA